MKLKTILGVAIAGCAALIMSVSAYAATDIKAGNITATDTVVTVPIEFTSTDLEKGIGAFSFQIYYDNTKLTPGKVVDLMTYTDDFGDEVNIGSIGYNLNYAEDKVSVSWYINNADAYNVSPKITNGDTYTVANVLFKYANGSTEITSNDFTITNVVLGDMYDTRLSCNTIFQFDVTGDLGGNEVVALAASTDGGVTKQPLNYYLSTNWEEGTEYANATTKFLVAINNTTGAVDYANITIYGEKADGTYVPLADYDQSNLLVQTFKDK